MPDRESVHVDGDIKEIARALDGLTGGQRGGVVKHIQHRIDPDTITALCGHTEGVGRYGADRAWADGVLDDQPTTQAEARASGYDCERCLAKLPGGTP